DNGDIDYGSVDRMVEFYLERGVAGMTILGMMGEAQKLTAAESVAVARHVLRRVGDRVPVVVGVSSPGFAAMRELTAAVMDAGAAGGLGGPPSTLDAGGDGARYLARRRVANGGEPPFR